jgi:hypothetical protein
MVLPDRQTQNGRKLPFPADWGKHVYLRIAALISTLGIIVALGWWWYAHQHVTAQISRTGGVRPITDAFFVAGKPIHPAVVGALLCPMEASKSFVQAVDVEGFDDADGFEISTSPAKYGAFRLDEDGKRTNEYIGYKHVGVLPNGVHVLDVVDWGGGSGVFRSLLFVTLEESSTLGVVRDRRRRVLLSAVDQVAMGDRNEATVVMEGDAVVIQGAADGELDTIRSERGRIVLRPR